MYVHKNLHTTGCTIDSEFELKRVKLNMNKNLHYTVYLTYGKTSRF